MTSSSMLDARQSPRRTGLRSRVPYPAETSLWCLLRAPDGGFLKNDTLTIKTTVTVKPPVGDWHDSKARTGYVGLKNQGATCYLNSWLQTLFHINYFRKVPTAAPVCSAVWRKVPQAALAAVSPGAAHGQPDFMTLATSIASCLRRQATKCPVHEVQLIATG